MQTAGDVYGKLKGLVGDPEEDWITPSYFYPLVNTAYDQAIQYLKGTCSPYIEKVVVVSGVSVGQDESSLIPSNQGVTTTNPLKRLVEPRWIDFKVTGTANNFWRPAKKCTILPDGPPQVTPSTYDFRVRGDFLPDELTTMDSLVEVHPNAAYALALSTAALIGIERPNEGWVQNYGQQAVFAWQEIAADLARQQQGNTWRLGSPNRVDRYQGYGWNWNLVNNMSWEWRSFSLYVKLC